MAQFVGFFLWNAAMAMAGISRIGQIGLLQPIFVALIAAAFAREPLDPVTLMFVGAVIATVAIGTRLRVKRSPGPA
jgi:drug/metabolite transporter (DMT)-like permease